MKNCFSVAVLALALTGCAGVSPVTVQELAVKGCSFLPTAETIAGIIAAKVPALDTASAIANAICAAVNRPATPSRSGMPQPPTVAGVPIEGQRVNR